MPSEDIVSSQNTNLLVLNYQPMSILDKEGNLIKDQDLAFLLRVLIQQVALLRVQLEQNELDMSAQ